MINQTRITFFSPDDDTTGEYLKFLKGATQKVRLCDYSFNMQAIVDSLIALHKGGVDVQLVLDKSQAGGKTEVPEVAQLKAAGVPMAIGTSSKHKIMHDKFTILDDAWVQSGSWNYTNSASLENNFFDIEHSPTRAAAFNKQWDEMWQYITTQGVK
jgi:phosphatidylserine/phosphatidylglycerophosphate/cardiolipin synthase-like enzyme